jgi:hypothetical protein
MSLSLLLFWRMFFFLAVLAANVIGTVFLCLFMLYAALIILFVICTFVGALGLLALHNGLRRFGLQV